MNGELKGKNNYSPSPDEKEEKLEFFKREEIRTMAKDLLELREEEAKKEREKIAGLKTEEKKKEEKLKKEFLVPKKPARKFLPPVFTRPIFSKLSPFEKIFIRIASIIIIILFLFFIFTFWYWYSAEMKKLSYSPLPIPSPTEKVISSPEITPTPTPSPTPTFSITDNILNVGYKIPSSPRLIDTIIIHSTYNTAGENAYDPTGIIEELKKNKVTFHYLISREGTIFRLCPDAAIAYHAGTSKMPDGRTNVNNFSIGIGLIYKREDTPNEIQYQALSYLVRNLIQQYNIPSENILGRKDVSSTKDDPWNFDWEKFYQLIK
jgi:hypothetical protein